jgi:two-component system chemotaxis response regulator CheY
MTTLLIVDDEFSLVQTLEEILVWEGFRVRTAHNGQQGLDRVADGVDLAVIDFMMPVMDGVQMVRAMKQRPDLSRIPIIMMSGAPREVAANDAPWDAFLAKPFTPEQLVKCIRGVMRRQNR